MAKKSRDGAPLSPNSEALNRGLMEQRRGNLSEAERLYRTVLKADPANVQASYLLGILFYQADQLDISLKWLQQTLALRPKFPRAWNDLGNTLRDLGQIEGAIDAYRKALKQQPDLAIAHCSLAQMRNHSEPDAAASELEALQQTYARSKVGGQDRADLAWGLARAIQQRGDCEQAFAYLVEAHRISHRGRAYHAQDTAQYFERIRTAITEEVVISREGWGEPSDLPIFVFGMPRSGTSLVEQVLASHSDVFGAGEQRLIGNLCAQLERQSGLTFAEAFVQLNRNDVGSAARAYVSQLLSLAPNQSKIVDKMPANFLALGMLAIMLPRAKFIQCKRHPMAVCWSIFSTRFAEPHAYSDDLSDLGAYYRSYDEHMTYWQQLFPERIFQCDYEQLIASPQQQIKSLLAFCGLEYQSSCLQFHKTERAVRTASAAQVRQPLYKSSLQSYKNFEPWLEPLSLALGDALVDG